MVAGRVKVSLLFLVFFLFFNTNLFADVEFETSRYRISLGSDGRWKSIVDRTQSPEREVCYGTTNYFALLKSSAGVWKYSSSIVQVGDNIQVSFGGTTTVITYQIEVEENFLGFKIVSITGDRPREISAIRVPVNISQNTGSLLAIAWDTQTSVCLFAVSNHSKCRGYYKSLRVEELIDSPGPNYEGAELAVIVSPTWDIENVLKEVSHHYPAVLTNEDANGVPSKENLGRESYWFFTSMNHAQAPQAISYCKKTGINQVLLGFGSWALTAGHIQYNTGNFPLGAESLRNFVSAMNAEGIGVGSHGFVSKVNKNDAYVTPVPLHEFWVERETTLGGNIGLYDTTITVNGSLSTWPGGPSCSESYQGNIANNYEFTLNGEIIKYSSVGGTNYNTFYGCTRGAYGTYKSSHNSGDRVEHWYTEGSGRYIIDPEYPLIDDVAQRMADVFNECNFNMVYFDGGEDVPKTRFSYYASLVQYKALEKFTVKPFKHLGTAKTHRLWSSFTTGCTADTWINTNKGSGKPPSQWYYNTVKKHINRSVSWILASERSLMPGELGWFGIWPRKEVNGELIDGLQMDEMEYLMAKTLAYDSPVSLETSFSEMASHPLTNGLLEIVKLYERFRKEGNVPASTISLLKTLNVDYAVISQDAENYEWVRVTALDGINGNSDIKAWTGTTANGDTLITMWHVIGESASIDIGFSDFLSVYDVEGNEIELAVVNGRVQIPVGKRRLALVFRNMNLSQSLEFLESSAMRKAAPPEVVPDSRLIGYWPFSGHAANVGTLAPVGDGVLNGDAEIISDTERGNVLALDGDGDFITHDLYVPKDQGTICHWLKPGLVDRFVAYYESDGTTRYHDGFGSLIDMLEINTGLKEDGTWAGVYQDGLTTVEIGGGEVIANQWCHVAMSWDRAADLVLYVDGDEKSRVSLSDVNFSDHSPTNAIMGSAAGGRTQRFFNGYVDEVRVYDAVLDSTEVSEVMAIGEASGLDDSVASNPWPTDKQQGVPIASATLSWNAGSWAKYHNLFFGTDFNSVASATMDSNEYIGTFEESQHTIHGLEPEGTYYWAVDEVNDSNYAIGYVWSFTAAEKATCISSSGPTGNLSWQQEVFDTDEQVIVVGYVARDFNGQDMEVESVSLGGQELLPVDGSFAIYHDQDYLSSGLYYITGVDLADAGVYDVNLVFAGLVDEAYAFALPALGVEPRAPEAVTCGSRAYNTRGIFASLIGAHEDALVVSIAGSDQSGSFILSPLMQNRLEMSGQTSSANLATTNMREGGYISLNWDHEPDSSYVISAASFVRNLSEQEKNLNLVDYQIVNETPVDGGFVYSIKMVFENIGSDAVDDTNVEIPTQSGIVSLINNLVHLSRIEPGQTVVSLDSFMVETDHQLIEGQIDFVWEYTDKLEGDLSLDGTIDLKDMAELIYYWLYPSLYPELDLYKDGHVNILDFAIMADIIEQTD